jgi:tRNA uracil 4-sulfurtransferase
MYKVAISLGEMTLKGFQTRSKFETLLKENLKKTLNIKKIRKDGGKFLLEIEEEDKEKIKYKLERTFGIATFSFVEEYKYTNIDELKQKIKEKYPNIKGKKFRITGKVLNQKGINSIELQKILGEVLFKEGGIVKLKEFDLEIFVYLRENKVQIYEEVHKGSYGLPLGSQGKVLVLFSGGLDSPVASYEIMRRGCKPLFLFINLGGNEHLSEVYEIYRKLCDEWANGIDIDFYVLDGKPIVKLIKENITPSYRQVVLKKCFYVAAEKLCLKNKCDAIITGENLGQVSTQTLKNLNAIQSSINKLIIRPLITYEKDEIVSLAKFIGTYELSSHIGELCNISDKGGIKTASSVGSVEFEYSKIKEDVEGIIENVSIDTLTPGTTKEIDWNNSIIIDLSKEKIDINNLNKDTFYVICCKDGIQASIECDTLKELGFNCKSIKTSKIPKKH